MTSFTPFIPSDDEPQDVDLSGCQCPNPDDQYLMGVDCGSVGFVHAACGLPPGDWADDAFSMQAVPVTLHWHVTKDYWTGEVDAYGDITINGLPAVEEAPR